GRGPRIPIGDVMDPAIRHGAWVATIWTALVWVAAGLTVHYASSHPRLEPGVGAATTRGDAEQVAARRWSPCALGSLPDHRTESSNPPPHRSPGHRQRQYRPAWSRRAR